MSPVYIVPAVLGVLSLIGSALKNKRKPKVGCEGAIGAGEESAPSDPLASLTEGADEIEPAGMPADDEAEDAEASAAETSETNDTPPTEGGASDPAAAPAATAAAAAAPADSSGRSAPAVPRYAVGSRVLRPKMPPMRGTDVTALQVMLNGIGTNPRLRADGVYNMITIRAVKAYQGRHRQPITGVVERATWARLLAGVPPKPNAPKPAPARRSNQRASQPSGRRR